MAGERISGIAVKDALMLLFLFFLFFSINVPQKVISRLVRCVNASGLVSTSDRKKPTWAGLASWSVFAMSELILQPCRQYTFYTSLLIREKVFFYKIHLFYHYYYYFYNILCISTNCCNCDVPPCHQMAVNLTVGLEVWEKQKPVNLTATP